LPILNIINSLKRRKEDTSLTMTKLSAGAQAGTNKIFKHILSHFKKSVKNISG
jgi:hypothetical protein